MLDMKEQTDVQLNLYCSHCSFFGVCEDFLFLVGLYLKGHFFLTKNTFKTLEHI